MIKTKPVFGTDLSKPVSEIIAMAREHVYSARKILDDLSQESKGTAEHVAPAKGAITCVMHVLFDVREDYIKAEKARALRADAVDEHAEMLKQGGI